MPSSLDESLGRLSDASKSFGATAAGFLRDRLNKKQYDDFLDGPNKDFGDKLRQAQDLLLDESNPDAPMQGVKMLQGAFQSYMDEGAKYPENPLVAQRVKQTWDMNMDFLGKEFAMKTQAANADKQADVLKQKGDLNKANIDKFGAQANLAKARADSLNQKTDAARDPGLFSGAPGSIQGGDEDTKAENMWNAIEHYTPKNASQRIAIDVEKQDIKTAMAQQQLAFLSGQGSSREVASKSAVSGVTNKPYDIHDEKDLAAVAATIDPQEVNARWIMQKAKQEATQQGMSPEVFDKKFGVRVDPTRASAFNPITKAVPETTVGKIMFGIGGWGLLTEQGSKVEPKTMEEAAARLPESLDKLQGPIAKVFKDTISAGKDEKIKTVEDVRMLLSVNGYSLAKQIVGGGAETSSLDEGMQRNRTHALTMIKAMANKYAPQVAEQMGIKIPKPKKTGMSDEDLAKEPGFGDLFRLGGSLYRGAKKSITSTVNEYTE